MSDSIIGNALKNLQIYEDLIDRFMQ